MGKLKEDPRVQELAQCVVFALNNMKNTPCFDPATNRMGLVHSWFRRALTDVGFVVTYHAPEPRKPRKQKRSGK